MIREGEIIFNNRSSLDLNLRLENYPIIPLTREYYDVLQLYMRPDHLIMRYGTSNIEHLKF